MLYIAYNKEIVEDHILLNSPDKCIFVNKSYSLSVLISYFAFIDRDIGNISSVVLNSLSDCHIDFAADAFFAVATVLSCLVFLRDFVVVAFVGPLRTSFGGMISDIIRFFILFIFVWISFALGMTQLYTTYELVDSINCYDNKGKCSPSPFQT